VAHGPPIEHTFVFTDAFAARRFVERVVLTLTDVAIYIDDTRVTVWGDGVIGRHAQIVRLSRESGALERPPPR
jgi:hypothetical protein